MQLLYMYPSSITGMIFRKKVYCYTDSIVGVVVKRDGFFAGLPPESSFICYEQAIAYNLSHLLLRGHINILVGGIHKSTTILHRSLYRGT